jgi:hypothetical protein
VSHPISSDWTGSSGPTQTYYQLGQTLADWLDTHVAAVDSSATSYPPDTAYPIVSTWTSGGQPIEVSTPYEPPETLEHWLSRHFGIVRGKMGSSPPDK